MGKYMAIQSCRNQRGAKALDMFCLVLILVRNNGA